MSGVALLQVLVVAGALRRRYDVIRRLRRERDGERDTFTHMYVRRCVFGYSESSTILPTAIPFKDISAHADLSACPSASIYHLESIIFHSVYHSSLYVLSTSADNCFPSPSALCLRLFIALLLLCRPQSMAPPSPHRSTLSRLLICAKGGRDGGREGGGRLAGYTRTSDGLSAPSSSHNSDLSPPPRPSFSLFRVDPWRTELGGREEVVFQRRCAGQPAFIRMNQRGDKISPVTKQGYEIRALIEFSSPGRGCGALNIIEFDRLMKRAPVLVLPLSTGRREREKKKSRPLLPHAYVRMLMFKHVRPPKVDVAKHGGLFFFRISTFVCSQCSTLCTVLRHEAAKKYK